MNSISLLIQLAGLSQREAADFLEVDSRSIDKMCRGKSSTPPGVIAELQRLINTQATAAAQALGLISEQLETNEAPEHLEIGYPVDDVEAQALGFPCVGAWFGMAARIVAECEIPIKLVPRGSTVSTAAAADLRERKT